jgi:hypothetical protein
MKRKLNKSNFFKKRKIDNTEKINLNLILKYLYGNKLENRFFEKKILLKEYDGIQLNQDEKVICL